MNFTNEKSEQEIMDYVDSIMGKSILFKTTTETKKAALIFGKTIQKQKAGLVVNFSQDFSDLVRRLGIATPSSYLLIRNHAAYFLYKDFCSHVPATENQFETMLTNAEKVISWLLFKQS